jgi:hypothetical protein
MLKKMVMHLFHADESSLNTGTHVSERTRKVKEEHNVALEVYVFGPAERALGDPARAEFLDALASLAKSGVPVHVCRTIAEEMGTAVEFDRLGFTLEYTRDAFVRFPTEGATVISF